jgi:hypothetical protein
VSSRVFIEGICSVMTSFREGGSMIDLVEGKHKTVLRV